MKMDLGIPSSNHTSFYNLVLSLIFDYGQHVRLSALSMEDIAHAIHFIFVQSHLLQGYRTLRHPPIKTTMRSS